MFSSPVPSDDASPGTGDAPLPPPRLFTRAALALAVAWCIAAALAVWLAWALPGQRVADVLFISLGSGLVAACSLVPGLLCQWRRRGCEDSASAQDHLPGLMSAAGIRLAGTVALFVLCRYQMAATSAESIAAWVLAWYGVLTVVEVTAVARELSNPPFAGSTRVGRSQGTAPTRPQGASVAGASEAPGP